MSSGRSDKTAGEPAPDPGLFSAIVFPVCWPEERALRAISKLGTDDTLTTRSSVCFPQLDSRFQNIRFFCLHFPLATMRFAPSRVLSLLFPILCLADPEADPQTYTNNAPFSGAIYIVNPNGQQVTTTDANMCPSYASVSCGSIGQPSW